VKSDDWLKGNPAVPGGPVTSKPARHRRDNPEDRMDEPTATRARQIARAASDFERERTGRRPKGLAVVLGGETLVVTLHGALSPAEQALAGTPAGAALVRELHRALFANACGPLRQEVGRITGAEVREATAEVQGATGTVVQVFLLAGDVLAETWSGAPPDD
jgi:uncharacterized protein YbcI